MKRIVLACVLALASMGLAQAQQRVLNVYNWSTI